MTSPVTSSGANTDDPHRRPLSDGDLFRIALPRAPSVSPDGEQLLYLLETPDAATNQTLRCLKVLRIADREERPVDGLGPVLRACWLADGSILAVLPDGDGARLERIGPDGGAARWRRCHRPRPVWSQPPTARRSPI